MQLMVLIDMQNIDSEYRLLRTSWMQGYQRTKFLGNELNNRFAIP